MVQGFREASTAWRQYDVWWLQRAAAQHFPNFPLGVMWPQLMEATHNTRSSHCTIHCSVMFCSLHGAGMGVGVVVNEDVGCGELMLFCASLHACLTGSFCRALERRP